MTGLEVIASDPPDSAVYVLPGIAVDSIGQTIIVHEPRAFDMGQIEGLMYLIISYNESRPQVGNGRAEPDAPLYVQTQYSLEAVDTLPATPYVELARVWRHGAGTPIIEAKVQAHPRSNEIDLRYRSHVGYTGSEPIAVAVTTLRGAEDARHSEGMANLASSLRHVGSLQVWVDQTLPQDGALESYSLLYLVGRDSFQLSSDEMSRLYGYLQQGGTIFYESCRQNANEADPAGDAAFLDLTASFGIQLQAPENNHPLLREPNLFGQFPEGFETRGTPTVRIGEGIVFSTFDFGCIWRGERRGRPASRSEIRNAMEWGENLITFAAARRKAKGQ